ncbi:HD domain-containing phosphohydrolase [Noviherbaspirillum suwonense]|uniref:3',5'-cyclic-nucleotide phosphodiesterase n=1 Tax=Noviherbaspirillum suwonense TaxID=1224511 RepID=A0ABY1Q829_9BURK|nr:HD domain-containing phosphohydrolase [Noviherbaspirillum suwonense]SMP62287.1 3',5'-cyclic-nucleotide phosphodiesterase [Noviherbaspirillum suwonense]
MAHGYTAQTPAQSAPAGVSAYLELAGAGDEKAQVFPLLDEAVIGRGPQDSLALDRFIRIPNHTVSRRHARIRRRGDGYFVEDLHSFNGTFVLGVRLEPGVWHPLRDGDELSIAAIPLVFHSLVTPAAASTPTIITRSVAAADLTRFAPPGDDAGVDMARTVLKLRAMAQVGIALGAVTDRATLTEKIMNFIFQLFPLAERAFILLQKKEGEAPVPVGARWRDGTVLDPAKVVMSRTILAEVVGRKHSVLSVDTLSDRHFGAQESIVSQAIRSVMCVPLLLEGECLGLIQVDTSSDPYAFREQDLEMLTGVCAEAAVALKNFQLYSDIEGLLDGFVRASVQAIEERDPVTAGHSFRVAGYAERLAEAVGRSGALPPERRFSREQMREIRYAALLHDFGKVGVREHVLRKEKKLHRAEMHAVEQRFLHVRACLEREAWRGLVEQHAAHGLPPDDFRQRQRDIGQALRLEFDRLDRFLATIRSANEPAISKSEVAPELGDAMAWCCPQPDGPPLKLLTEDEHAALGVMRGCLTPDERRQIEAHVADSYSFLILIPWTRDLAGVPSIAHGHHEKLDGSGYPMGLRAPQISPQTRILTICDIYDALTAGDRPYKKAMPPDRALDLIAMECRAGHLDGQLFDVFVQSRAWEPL